MMLIWCTEPSEGARLILDLDLSFKPTLEPMYGSILYTPLLWLVTLRADRLDLWDSWSIFLELELAIEGIFVLYMVDLGMESCGPLNLLNPGLLLSLFVPA